MKKTWTTLFGLAAFAVTSLASAQDLKGDAQAGSGKVAMCIGCHSIPGYQASFPEVYKVPMISGQGAPYIAAALHAYQKGERLHPTMRGIADSLSDQDIADVAAFYAAQGPQGDQAPKAREPGEKVAPLLQKGACVSCHGDNFSKPIDPSYPKIAGQHADYLFAALKAYKASPGEYVGRSNGVMGGIAKQFSNAELKELAKYIGSLDGELRVVPQSRFR
ncbi:Cytochrome c553 [Oryzisolibacter propanilivorax]|uniref:Cytochrome c553 n=1 Tax=Oryzisolibacter propanilivorax TaxID=1527607 RepID=A0A1G9RL44_9BURK|nr:c-type cytochrome [Oryzisolibacter propanilivorax]SDM23948.1 Cytochrome c553 [Oryzisolibacter propanilivorax]